MRFLARICFGVVFASGLSTAPLNAQSAERRAVDRPQCELPAAPYQGSLSIPAPQRADARAAAGATFQITYLPKGQTLFGYKCANFPSNARTALQYATGIWGGLLTSAVPIRVNACWSTQLGRINPGALAAASAVSLVRDFPGAPQPGTWYQVAMANALSGVDQNGTTTAELQIVFNGRLAFGSWYFGTNALPPAGTYDLVSVALHELGHGLGFAGSAGIAETGSTRCPVGTPVGQGCIRRDGFPITYDTFAEDGSGVSLLNTATYPNPSTNLANALRGLNGGLFAEGPTVGRQRLYSPSTYQGGSTYSHWDLATYPNELMKPAFPSGQAIHDPGLAELLLHDVGWGDVSGARLPPAIAEWEESVQNEASTARVFRATVSPNPFNPAATLSLSVPETQPVQVTLFDLMGRQVQALYSGTLEAGAEQLIQIDGAALASGTYVVRILGQNVQQVQRVTLLK